MPQSKYASQIKHRKAHYKPLVVDLRPEVLEAFREACHKNNSSMSGEVKRFIAEYLAKGPDDTAPR